MAAEPPHRRTLPGSVTAPAERAPIITVTAEAESLDAFEHAISSTCAPVRLRPTQRPEFRGRLRAASADGLMIAKLRTTPGRVVRTERMLGSGDPHFVKLMWQRAGTSRLEQRGRRCTVPAGTLVAYETRQPYALECEGESWAATVAAVPSHRFGPHLRPITARSAVPLGAGSGAARALVLLMNELTGLGLPGVRHAADALTSLALTVWTALPPASEDVENPTLADRVRIHALANLGDPGLCVDSIAAHLGVSVRLIHKACAQEGFTAAAWIRQQRLECIHRDLNDPALADRTTATVAARWGIVDASHLARQFRTVFGCSPAEVRGGSSAA